MKKGVTKKPSRETIRKRVAGQKRAREKRRRMRMTLIPDSADPVLAAKARLDAEGYCSHEAVQRRIRWVAHERKLPPIDICQAMTCKLHHLSDFAKRYELSVDWLMFGDLKGLRRKPVGKQSPAIFTAADIVKLYAELSMEDRRQITRMMAKLMAQEAAEQS